MDMKMIAGACLCAAAIVGCVSIEDTRAQLKSNDPAQVKQAEENILKVVTYQALTSDRPEKYVEIVESNELLGKIISCSQDPKTVAAAINKLDPSKPGTPNELLLGMMEKLEHYDERLKIMSKKLDFSQHGLMLELYFNRNDLLWKIDVPVDSVCANLNEDDAVKILKGTKNIHDDLRDAIGLRLVEMTQNAAILYDMYNGKLGCAYHGKVMKMALQKLIANADKISDKSIVIKLLKSDDVKEEGQRKKLISSLPAEDAEIYTLNECKDDKTFYEAFKKAGEQVKAKVLGRALKMKDEALLVDLIRMNPNYADKVVDSVGSWNVKTSELAMLLLDNVKNVTMSSCYNTNVRDVEHFVVDLVSKLDAKARAKYLKVAKENLEDAKKDNIIFGDKFYVNMPAIDYAIISFEENLEWPKNPLDEENAAQYLWRCADMKTDISGKDWRKEWKINVLLFGAKDRQKCFNVKGTLEGLIDFVRKYIDKSATIRDITINGGDWQFSDDKHGLAIFLNDKSGMLQINCR